MCLFKDLTWTRDCVRVNVDCLGCLSACGPVRCSEPDPIRACSPFSGLCLDLDHDCSVLRTDSGAMSRPFSFKWNRFQDLIWFQSFNWTAKCHAVSFLNAGQFLSIWCHLQHSEQSSLHLLLDYVTVTETVGSEWKSEGKTCHCTDKNLLIKRKSVGHKNETFSSPKVSNSCSLLPTKDSLISCKMFFF